MNEFPFPTRAVTLDERAIDEQISRESDGVAEAQFSADRGVYVCEWCAPTFVRVEFDRFATERSELSAEIVVRSTIPGLAQQLYRKRLNLLATRSVAEFAKALDGRTKAQNLDWPALLEAAIEQAIRAHREGDPAILLNEVLSLAPEALYALQPLVLRDLSTFLYGRPGGGKTYIMMAIACALQGGRTDLLGLAPSTRLNVLVLDHEGNGAPVLADRARQITGAEGLPITYLECRVAIWDEIDRILRVIRERHIDFVCSDSVGMACGGLPPESSEAALRYGAAVRRIGLGGIHIAHLTKDGVNEDYPFGSQFWQAQARLTWLVKKRQDLTASDFTVGLYNKKTNVGPYAAPLGYDIKFGPSGVRFQRTDVRDQPELASSLPVAYRMAHALRGGQREIGELAEEIEATADAVRVAAIRGVKAGKFVVVERDGKKWVGLRAREAS